MLKKEKQARRLHEAASGRGIRHAPTLLDEAARILAAAPPSTPRTYRTPPLVAFLLGALAAGFALCIAAPFI